MSVNKVILVGNVGKDPEIRHLDSGVVVANFPLATSETYTAKNGERVTTTEWHNIVLWRGLAEVAEKYVKKGQLLYIDGKIRTRSYDDKEGNKRYMTEIYGDTMRMLGGKGTTDTQQNQNTPASTTSASAATTETPTKPVVPETDDTETDDLPF
jgi:single-strand DNA-binding protein